MAAKLPWMPWFAGDWMADPSVGCCSPSTRGIWVDVLNVMHLAGRVGTIAGTVAQLARSARCSPDEMLAALTELRQTGAADIESDGDLFTITNRRMAREHRKRQGDAARQVRSRASRASTEVPVETESKPVSAKPEKSKAKETPKQNNAAFDAWYSAYPKRCARRAAEKAYASAVTRIASERGVSVEAAAAELVKATTRFADSKRGEDPKYIPHPATWLNAGRYDDDPETLKQGNGNGRSRYGHSAARIRSGEYSDPNAYGNSTSGDLF